MLLKNVNTGQVRELTEAQAVEQIKLDAEAAGCPECDGTIKRVKFAMIGDGRLNVTCSNRHDFMVTPFAQVDTEDEPNLHVNRILNIVDPNKILH